MRSFPKSKSPFVTWSYLPNELANSPITTEVLLEA